VILGARVIKENNLHLKKQMVTIEKKKTAAFFYEKINLTSIVGIPRQHLRY